MRQNNINELIRQFLEYLEIEKNRSIKTIENYRHYLKRFLEFSKIKDPEEITNDLIRRYRLYLNRLIITNSKKNASFSKLTQNYHLIALRGFLKYLAKRNIKSLAAEQIELAKVSRREIEFLEQEELLRLIEAPKGKGFINLRDRAILELLFSTGLRVSELCNLNRDDINLKKGEFAVKGKGNKIRVVFLSERAKNALKQYLEKRTDINDALFIRKKKQKNEKENLRLTPRTIQRLIKKYAARAGIPKKITPHTIRHSFATDLLRSGADLRSVQALLGHSNISTTQIYTHYTDKTLKEIHKRYHGKSININNT